VRKAIRTCILVVLLLAAGSLPAVADVTNVVPVNEGSSNPTYFATNHRVAVTAGGRMLIIHGRHSRGVQLRWKNAGSSSWNTTTKGAVTDGILLDGTGSGDWPSSIAVAKGSDGKERAWVVIGDVNFVGSNPIRMRVLSGLDAAGGPTVGPMVTVDSSPRGDAFVDIAMERRAGGGVRGAIAFVERIDNNSWNLAAKWFTNTTSSTPPFTSAHTILSATTGRKAPTLVPTSAGLSLFVRGSKGAVTRYVHDRRQTLTTWHQRGTGVKAGAKAKVSATGLSNGDVVMAVEDNVISNHLTVQRFKPGGKVTSMLQMSGFSMPSVASNAKDVWLVMIRDGDNAVVSRHFNPLSGWSGIRVEVSAAHGGHHAWPNVLRAARGRLRFVVREGSMGSTRSGVVAVDRAAARGPDCTKRGTNGNNTLVGTPGRDILCGNGGNDVLRGLGGRDVLLGGKGRDSLNGGPGKDYLDGGAGFDHCSREPGGTRISCERRL